MGLMSAIVPPKLSVSIGGMRANIEHLMPKATGYFNIITKELKPLKKGQ